MTDRPRSDDDDNTPFLPEVTVPPWLRTGPTSDPQVPAAPADYRSAADADDSDAGRAGAPGHEDSAPPTRITLGARARKAVADALGSEDASGSGPTSGHRREPAVAPREASADRAGRAGRGEPADGRRGAEASATTVGGAVDDLSQLPLRGPASAGAASAGTSSATPSPAKPTTGHSTPGKPMLDNVASAPSTPTVTATDTAVLPAKPHTAATPPTVAESTDPASGAGRDSAGGAVEAGRPAETEEGAGAPSGNAGVGILARRPARIALLAVAGIAILGGSAVLGFVVARGATSGGAESMEAGVTPGCEESDEPGLVTGSGPGTLATPSGTVLAFDHAYYVDRSAEKAFEAVSPSSRMTEEQLRVEGIDQLAEGTTHCVEVSELAPTLLAVDLTEFPPEGESVLIRQHIRVAENSDGTWGIVSITPAG